METKSANQQASQTPGEDFINGNFGSTATPESELHETGEHTNTGKQNDIGSAPGEGEPNDETVKNDEPTKQTEGTASVGALVSSDTVIALADVIIPSSIAFGAKKIGYELDKKDYQLTAKERDLLSPIVQKCLDDLKLNLNNPWHALTVSVAIIYGSKFFDKHENIKKIKKKVVKPNFTQAPQYNFPVNQPIAEPINEETTNEYEKIKQEEAVAEANLSAQDRKLKKLVDDTRKKRKDSRAKSIQWLKGKGKLPPNYIYPEL